MLIRGLRRYFLRRQLKNLYWAEMIGAGHPFMKRPDYTPTMELLHPSQEPHAGYYQDMLCKVEKEIRRRIP